MKTIYLIPLLLLCAFCNAEPSTQAKINDIPTPEEVIVLDKSKHNIYTWKVDYEIENKLQNRILAPKGFERTEDEKNSFADWLRNIPLKAGNPKVKLYNGNLKGNQTAQYAVLDIDVGTKDLQQCADAVMRLRAEYLFANKKYSEIAFNFTSGDKCSFKNWAEGVRPVFNGNNVSFVKKAKKDYSYTSFKKYLQIIFSYCGTYSLEQELNSVRHLKDIQIGDVFIMGGFPGHAVIVMDIAENVETKEKVFLLAQSYMPAQDVHILKNPTNTSLSPWFSINFENELITPEWTFKKTSLKRF